MITLRVASPSPLLGEFVASFLHEVCPDAIITPDTVVAPGVARGARVTSASTGRWLYVAAGSQVNDELKKKVQTCESKLKAKPAAKKAGSTKKAKKTTKSKKVSR